MSTLTTNYLITGANRGIGRGLVSHYLLYPDALVIAAVRDPSHPTSKALLELPKAPTSTLALVPYNASSPTAASDVVKMLQSASHLLTHLDIVIANAGIANGFHTVADLPRDVFQAHLDVNALAPLSLFQATKPLLQQSKQPKFIAHTSTTSSVGGMQDRPFDLAAYGASKATLNWLVRKMHFEEEWLCVFPLEPGWVRTEMGNKGAQHYGLDQAGTDIKDSIAGVTKTIDGATRETTGGHFVVYDGSEMPW